MINFPFLPVEGLHEFNLDWFLNRFKELSEEWDETKAAWLALKEYVETFFDELDVQEEINNKIDEMYENGTLSLLISNIIYTASMPVFVDSLDDMTNPLHVYVLTSNGHIYTYSNGSFHDTGLDYSNNGQAVKSSQLLITNNDLYTSLADLPTNSIIAINAEAFNNMTDAPEFSAGVVTVIDFNYNPLQNTGGRVQLVFTSAGFTFYRIKWSNNFSSWYKINNTGSILTNTDVIDNFDNLPINSVFAITSGAANNMSNKPPWVTSHAIVETLSISSAATGATIQRYSSAPLSYYRIKWGTDEAFSTWRKVGFTNIDSIFTSITSLSGLNSIYADLNTVPINQTLGYGDNANKLANSPTSTQPSSVINTFGLSSSLPVCHQEINYYTSGEKVYRTGWQTYGKWRSSYKFYGGTCVFKPLNINSDSYIIQLGDSIATNLHGGNTILKNIADAVGCQGYNAAVSSAVISHSQNNNSLMAQINTVTGAGLWNRATHVLVFAGTNDCGLNYDHDIIKADLISTINAIKTQAPNAKIIWVTPIHKYNEGIQDLHIVSSIICHTCLQNDVSVIYGLDFPFNPVGYYENIPRTTVSDGIHPDAQGKKILANCILQHLI